jgi:hypothetical protein
MGLETKQFALRASSGWPAVDTAGGLVVLLLDRADRPGRRVAAGRHDTALTGSREMSFTLTALETIA